MRIGLYGIYGVYNFGCEAIVRGTYELIKKLYPNCTVVYFSYNYEYDSRRLSDVPIKVCEVKKSKNLIKRAVNVFLGLIHTEKRIKMIDTRSVFSKVDVIFSIGGDIYTIPKNVMKRKKYEYYNPTVDFCDKAIKKGKDVILYGASVGPFGEYGRAVDYYKRNLGKYMKIVCREYDTINYLGQIGVNNTMFMPDPAFQVSIQKKKNVEKKYLGINLSPLSLEEIYGCCDSEWLHKYASVIESIYDEFKIDILFIPHVISDEMKDNDYLFLDMIMNSVRTDVKAHIKIADYSQGFLGIKSALQECLVVASARMHCALNAVEQNIPTIFLSYSQKSMGMCEYVYGTKEWTLDIGDFEEQILIMMKKMLSQRLDITEYLKKRNQEIHEYFWENYKKILD